MRLALKHENICAAGLREVISDTRSNDAAADDDYVRGFHADAKLERISLKVKSERKLVAKLRAFRDLATASRRHQTRNIMIICATGKAAGHHAEAAVGLVCLVCVVSWLCFAAQTNS